MSRSLRLVLISWPLGDSSADEDAEPYHFEHAHQDRPSIELFLPDTL